MSIQRVNPGKRWSDITVFNGTAYFVEVAHTELDAGIQGQTQQILAQAESSLAKIGSDKTRLLSATIYLTDFSHLDAFNAIWDNWLQEGTAPSRACVKAELVDPRYLVEIAFVVAC